MQFIDLKAQYRKIQNDVAKRMNKVLEHSQFIMGPEVGELEQRLAKYAGVKHCIGISSGSDALLISLMALNIGLGDEVITTPFSFIATATMAKLVGAKPVYVDINPQTYNIDPALIEQAITPRTKAILPVNLYGQCADYDAINQIAKKYGLYVIEDAAQSFGATYKNRQSGSLGTIGCTSFFPSKPLGCYGDGGACFTDDDELAQRMRQILNHGQDGRYNHVRLGINGRLDTLQAAVLLSKLDIFSEELKLRAELVKEYNQLLSKYFSVPFIEPFNTSSYAQYTIMVENRDSMVRALSQQQIPTSIHYPVAIHQQPVMSALNDNVQYSLPYAEKAAKQVLSLPFHPYLTSEDVVKIVDAVVGQLKIEENLNIEN